MISTQPPVSIEQSVNKITLKALDAIKSGDDKFAAELRKSELSELGLADGTY